MALFLWEGLVGSSTMVVFIHLCRYISMFRFIICLSGSLSLSLSPSLTPSHPFLPLFLSPSLSLSLTWSGGTRTTSFFFCSFWENEFFEIVILSLRNLRTRTMYPRILYLLSLPYKNWVRLVLVEPIFNFLWFWIKIVLCSELARYLFEDLLMLQSIIVIEGVVFSPFYRQERR